MWGWIIFAIYIELFAVGMTFLAKNSQMKKYCLCLIPFVAFFYVDKILPNGFSALSIKIKNLGRLVITLVIVSILAYIYMQWGRNNLPEKEIGPITQLMLVPIVICVIILWVALVSATLTLMFGFGIEFKCEKLVCALLITIPFILIFINRNNRHYQTEFRRRP